MFGIVEDEPNCRLFLKMVEHRDGPTLKGLIQQHVREGTTIFTDGLPACEGLGNIKQCKYNTINHKGHFVDVQVDVISPDDEQRMVEETLVGLKSKTISVRLR